MANGGHKTDDLSSDSVYGQIEKGVEIVGRIAVGTGMPSVLSIPIPGSNGLAVGLMPRGFVPKGGSTSTLFFQTLDGRRHLRLDYGFNKNTNSVDFHWNQKGTKEFFGITDHTHAGKWGEGLYKGARAFRYTGRLLLVLGAVADVASIVTAPDRWRQTADVAGGWAGAWGGAEAGGAAGAAIGGALGSIVPVLGTAAGVAVGAFIGGIGGGIGGYALGSTMATYVYDHAPEALENVGASIEELDAEVVRTYFAGAM